MIDNKIALESGSDVITNHFGFNAFYYMLKQDPELYLNKIILIDPFYINKYINNNNLKTGEFESFRMNLFRDDLSDMLDFISKRTTE